MYDQQTSQATTCTMLCLPQKMLSMQKMPKCPRKTLVMGLQSAKPKTLQNTQMRVVPPLPVLLRVQFSLLPPLASHLVTCWFGHDAQHFTMCSLVLLRQSEMIDQILRSRFQVRHRSWCSIPCRFSTGLPRSPQLLTHHLHLSFQVIYLTPATLVEHELQQLLDLLPR